MDIFIAPCFVTNILRAHQTLVSENDEATINDHPLAVSPGEEDDKSISQQCCLFRRCSPQPKRSRDDQDGKGTNNNNNNISNNLEFPANIHHDVGCGQQRATDEDISRVGINSGGERGADEEEKETALQSTKMIPKSDTNDDEEEKGSPSAAAAAAADDDDEVGRGRGRRGALLKTNLKRFFSSRSTDSYLVDDVVRLTQLISTHRYESYLKKAACISGATQKEADGDATISNEDTYLRGTTSEHHDNSNPNHTTTSGVESNDPMLLRAVAKVYGPPILISGLFAGAAVGANVSAVYVLSLFFKWITEYSTRELFAFPNAIVKETLYPASEARTQGEGITYAFIIGTLLMVSTICDKLGILLCQRVFFRMRSAFTMLVTQHLGGCVVEEGTDIKSRAAALLDLRLATLPSHGGKYFHLWWTTLVMGGVVTYLLVDSLDWAGSLVLPAMFVSYCHLIPCALAEGRATAAARQMGARRVAFMNSVFESVRIIKGNSWLDWTFGKIKKMRQEELHAQDVQRTRQVFLFVSSLVSDLCITLSFVIAAYQTPSLRNVVLTPSKVLPANAYCSQLRSAFTYTPLSLMAVREILGIIADCNMFLQAPQHRFAIDVVVGAEGQRSDSSQQKQREEGEEGKSGAEPLTMGAQPAGEGGEGANDDGPRFFPEERVRSGRREQPFSLDFGSNNARTGGGDTPSDPHKSNANDAANNPPSSSRGSVVTPSISTTTTPRIAAILGGTTRTGGGSFAATAVTSTTDDTANKARPAGAAKGPSSAFTKALNPEFFAGGGTFGDDALSPFSAPFGGGGEGKGSSDYYKAVDTDTDTLSSSSSSSDDEECIPPPNYNRRGTRVGTSIVSDTFAAAFTSAVKKNDNDAGEERKRQEESEGGERVGMPRVLLDDSHNPNNNTDNRNKNTNTSHSNKGDGFSSEAHSHSLGLEITPIKPISGRKGNLKDEETNKAARDSETGGERSPRESSRSQHLSADAFGAAFDDVQNDSMCYAPLFPSEEGLRGRGGEGGGRDNNSFIFNSIHAHENNNSNVAPVDEDDIHKKRIKSNEASGFFYNSPKKHSQTVDDTKRRGAAVPDRGSSTPPPLSLLDIDGVESSSESEVGDGPHTSLQNRNQERVAGKNNKEYHLTAAVTQSTLVSQQALFVAADHKHVRSADPLSPYAGLRSGTAATGTTTAHKSVVDPVASKGLQALLQGAGVGVAAIPERQQTQTPQQTPEQPPNTEATGVVAARPAFCFVLNEVDIGEGQIPPGSIFRPQEVTGGGETKSPKRKGSRKAAARLVPSDKAKAEDAVEPFGSSTAVVEVEMQENTIAPEEYDAGANLNNNTKNAYRTLAQAVDLGSCTLNIPANAVVAITGPTGCGKSTVLKMLAGEVPLKKKREDNRTKKRDGEISTFHSTGTADSTSPKLLEEKTPASLHQNVRGTITAYGSSVFMTADGFVFEGTLAENIAATSDVLAIDMDRMEDALVDACLDPIKFQLDTPVSATSVSGGERLRISLARALYSPGDILLLDDPVSALDPDIAEEFVNECLVPLRKKKNRSVVIATNTASILRKAADYVVDLGQRSLTCRPTRVRELTVVEEQTQAEASKVASSRRNSRRLSFRANNSVVLSSSIMNLGASQSLTPQQIALALAAATHDLAGSISGQGVGGGGGRSRSGSMMVVANADRGAGRSRNNSVMMFSSSPSGAAAELVPNADRGANRSRAASAFLPSTGPLSFHYQQQTAHSPHPASSALDGSIHVVSPAYAPLSLSPASPALQTIGVGGGGGISVGGFRSARDRSNSLQAASLQLSFAGAGSGGGIGFRSPHAGSSISPRSGMSAAASPAQPPHLMSLGSGSPNGERLDYGNELPHTTTATHTTNITNSGAHVTAESIPLDNSDDEGGLDITLREIQFPSLEQPQGDATGEKSETKHNAQQIEASAAQEGGGGDDGADHCSALVVSSPQTAPRRDQNKHKFSEPLPLRQAVLATFLAAPQWWIAGIIVVSLWRACGYIGQRSLSDLIAGSPWLGSYDSVSDDTMFYLFIFCNIGALCIFTSGMFPLDRAMRRLKRRMFNRMLDSVAETSVAAHEAAHESGALMTNFSENVARIDFAFYPTALFVTYLWFTLFLNYVIIEALQLAAIGVALLLTMWLSLYVWYAGKQVRLSQIVLRSKARYSSLANIMTSKVFEIRTHGLQNFLQEKLQCDVLDLAASEYALEVWARYIELVADIVVSLFCLVFCIYVTMDLTEMADKDSMSRSEVASRISSRSLATFYSFVWKVTMSPLVIETNSIVGVWRCVGQIVSMTRGLWSESDAAKAKEKEKEKQRQHEAIGEKKDSGIPEQKTNRKIKSDGAGNNFHHSVLIESNEHSKFPSTSLSSKKSAKRLQKKANKNTQIERLLSLELELLGNNRTPHGKTIRNTTVDDGQQASSVSASSLSARKMRKLKKLEKARKSGASPLNEPFAFVSRTTEEQEGFIPQRQTTGQPPASLSSPPEVPIIESLVSGIALEDIPPFIAASIHQQKQQQQQQGALQAFSNNQFDSSSQATGGLGFSPSALSPMSPSFMMNHSSSRKPASQSQAKAKRILSSLDSLSLESLQMRYGNGPLVLKSLTFSAEQGTITIIKGSSGCGKSSMFLALLGLYPICGGRVRFGKTLLISPPAASPSAVGSDGRLSAAASPFSTVLGSANSTGANQTPSNAAAAAGAPLPSETTSNVHPLKRAQSVIDSYRLTRAAGGMALISESEEGMIREAYATRELALAEAAKNAQRSKRAQRWYDTLVRQIRKEEAEDAMETINDHRYPSRSVEPCDDRDLELTRRLPTALGASLSTPVGAWRALFSWVPQEPFMFEGSIVENLFPEVDAEDLTTEHHRRAARALIDVGLLTEEAVAKFYGVEYTPPLASLAQGGKEDLISGQHLQGNTTATTTIKKKIVITNEDSENYYMVDAEENAASNRVQAKSATSVLFPSSRVSTRGENLSGGERQRVGIARALLNTTAKIFIMDEPTSHLDSRSCTELLQKVKDRLCRAPPSTVGGHTQAAGHDTDGQRGVHSNSLAKYISDPALTPRNAVVIVISHQTAETAKVADQSITLIAGEAFKQ